MDYAVGQLAKPDSVGNQTDISGLPRRIAEAIKTAAARTGVNFSYLLNKAAQESSFDPNAKASTSSATGLFQFTSQTWLQMIKDHGDAYGLSNYASHISVDANGTAHVKDPAWRQAILNLRHDPQTSAEMAGELDKENLSSLQENVGGKIGATELYLAHFLGAGGASDFLNSLRENPKAKAADVLPEAASANPAVFYTSSGQPKSLAQIYQHFAQKFDQNSAGAPLVASATTPPAVSSSNAGAKSYAFAENIAVTDPASPSSTYVANVIGSRKADTSSSLMATMILAQMSISDSGNLAALSGSGADNDKNKKTFLPYVNIG